MRTLVVGGSASGKSEYAEELALSFDKAPLLYIATMEPFGWEALDRIERHRRMRAHKGFDTMECYRALESLAVPAGSTILLECVTNLAANEMFSFKGAGAGTVEAVLRGLHKLSATCAHLVVVSGNIFEDGTVYDAETTRYLHYLAEINRRLADDFDQVVEVVCGIPIIRKGVPYVAV